jgi:hypothetical protein
MKIALAIWLSLACSIFILWSIGDIVTSIRKRKKKLIRAILYWLARFLIIVFVCIVAWPLFLVVGIRDIIKTRRAARPSHAAGR